MLFAFNQGELEVRSEGGATRLRATFPYGAETELAAGRNEVFAPHAFAASIGDATREVHLLVGHDFNRPLASRAAGTMRLRDTDAALEIEATVDGTTSWARDFLAANAARLIKGVSPGFNVPAGGERIERRGSGVLRTVITAQLVEISVVTRGAYPLAEIEARSWSCGAPAVPRPSVLARYRR
jgi:HK97 family phage prohead protease